MRRKPIDIGRTAASVALILLAFLPLALWQFESTSKWGSALRYELVATQDDDSESPDSDNRVLLPRQELPDETGDAS